MGQPLIITFIRDKRTAERVTCLLKQLHPDTAYISLEGRRYAILYNDVDARGGFISSEWEDNNNLGFGNAHIVTPSGIKVLCGCFACKTARKE